MTTASPCISVCQMDETTHWCRGCYRTIHEIMVWGQSDETLKQCIMQELPLRHAQAAFPEAAFNPVFNPAVEAQLRQAP
jgi:uncharacterized protein